MEARIKRIMESVIARDDDADLVHEVRGLHDVFDDAVYQQKIRDAMTWAAIFIDPKQCTRWDTHSESGRNTVMRFLLDDLDGAAKIARALGAKEV